MAVPWWLTNVVLPVGVLLVVMWPTERTGFRLLRDWGVPEPRPDQVDEAVRYLWQRRILYAVLFVVVPPLVDRVLWHDAGQPVLKIFMPLLVAMLVAEVVATVRPVSGVRVASLDPRGWRDLVPRWAVVVAGVLVVLTVTWSVAGLVARPWADRFAAALPPNDEMSPATGWLARGFAAAAVALMVLLVHLAVRRPSVADAAVDAALRTRTARVAVGIGIGWLGLAVAQAADRVRFLLNLGPREPGLPAWFVSWFGSASQAVGVVAVLGAVVCWIWVANPTHRALTAARR
ncbi:hypothetical protein [Actinophytocola sp.]|uniref:hypothetical protein n=1 Tax=Actinophytocola sp. TaxID=1872138 RepID=UPI002ED14451